MSKIEPKRLSAWLNGRDTGISSESIFHHMTLGCEPAGYPHDPSDFARCLRLLDAFPEWKPRMPEMAQHGPVWAALADRWAEIEARFLEEAGGTLPDCYTHWSAPRTYDLMQEIIRPHERGWLDMGGIKMKVGK